MNMDINMVSTEIQRETIKKLFCNLFSQDFNEYEYVRITHMSIMFGMSCTKVLKMSPYNTFLFSKQKTLKASSSYIPLSSTYFTIWPLRVSSFRKNNPANIRDWAGSSGCFTPSSFSTSKMYLNMNFLGFSGKNSPITVIIQIIMKYLESIANYRQAIMVHFNPKKIYWSSLLPSYLAVNSYPLQTYMQPISQ